ncbi:MAG: acyl-CoA dehydrogenase family protein [Sandaracinaceae bacterium]|nr:acyl-CoA dehydrogenase family protein [Sandaracinaceae bacterium]
MGFDVSDDLQHLLDKARAFVEGSIYPVEQEAIHDFRAAEGKLAALRAEVKAMGMWAPQMPREMGGMGLSFLDHARLVEVLGRSPLGLYVFGCPAPDAGNMEILHKFGTKEQQARWLQPLVDGTIRSCFSMTEPDHAGSNPTWLGTTAVRDGDDYVINGHKWFTTSADGADIAIVMAVTNPDAPPHMRASQIIVPTSSPGFVHVRRISVMGEKGSGWSSHSELRYENVRVPISNRLGAEGAGFMIAQERLGPGRIHHCMRFLAISQRALELMCERAATRMVAPGKPLGTKQAVQIMIADSKAELDCARLYVYDTAEKIDRHGANGARVEISCVKFLVANTMQRILDRAIQIHGALGMTDDTPLAWFFRHERAGRIFDGADEVHKTSVARQLLKPYGLELGSQGK